MDGSFSNSQSSLGGSFNKSTLRRKVKKEYQNKDNDALKSQSDHKPLKRRAKSGGRSTSDDNNNDSCASLSMEEFASDNNRSLSSLGSSFRRRKVKKEYQNKDNDALKSQSDHKPLKRRAKSGGRSGSDDNNNDSCASLSMEEFASDNNRSLSSLGGSLRKSFRNILKPNNNDSSGVGRRERERKQYDCDDDESFSDRLQDDDSNIDEHIDQDRLMVILCKELEITCDDD